MTASLAHELAQKLAAHPALMFTAEDLKELRAKIDAASEPDVRSLVRFLTEVIEERTKKVEALRSKAD